MRGSVRGFRRRGVRPPDEGCGPRRTQGLRHPVNERQRRGTADIPGPAPQRRCWLSPPGRPALFRVGTFYTFGGPCAASYGRIRPRLCENRTRARMVPHSRSFSPPSFPELAEYAAQTGNSERVLGIWVTVARFSHSLDPKQANGLAPLLRDPSIRVPCPRRPIPRSPARLLTYLMVLW